MFKKLEIWQEAVVLIKKIYKYAEVLPKSEEYNLKSQLKRAVVSVALNIAEGKSRKTSKDFAHFLNIAIASLSEVKCILLICEQLEYFTLNEALLNEIEILGKKINSLYNKLMRDNNE